MMTKTQINKLIKMMNDLDYPFEAPLKESFIESIIQIEFNSNSTNCLEKLCNEVRTYPKRNCQIIQYDNF